MQITFIRRFPTPDPTLPTIKWLEIASCPQEKAFCPIIQLIQLQTLDP